MIDVMTERLLTMRGGHALPIPVSHPTLTKYCTKGVRSRVNGRVILLERVQVNNAWHTSVEAYHRFLKRLNEEPGDDDENAEAD